MFAASASGVEPALLPVAGPAEPAKLLGVKPAWLFDFENAGQPKTLPADGVVAWGAFAEPKRASQLLLADGGLLLADLVKSDGDELTVDAPLLGELKIPLDLLCGAILHPPVDLQARDKLEERLRAAQGDADRLILDNGDELAGTVLKLDAANVELETNVGKVKIEVAKLAALAFNPALVSRPRSLGKRAVLGLTDGSRLIVTKLGPLDENVEFTLAGKLSWQTGLVNVAAVQPLGFGRAIYLSDLKPSSYKHIPFLDLPWPWHADRNCLGTSLRAGGRPYLKGLGMHSAARLSYAIPPNARRFAAELAIDDQTAGRGSVTFRVYADNQQLHSSPVIRGNAPPQPISIDLPANAKTLSLLLDPADRGDEQDHANWLNARFEE